MSIFRAVREFFSSPPVSSVELPVDYAAEPQQPQLSGTGWEVTTGRLHRVQQERNVIYHNNGISGTCTGKIGELTGSVMVGLFEDLPTWLPSLLIRVTVRVDEGELTASLRERNGTVVSLPTPATLECNAELVSGRAWLQCDSGSTAARNIYYEVVII